MTQIIANHVIRPNQQSRSCAVESLQSRDRPTTMLYYVYQTLFLSRPHTNERKGSGYARLSGICSNAPINVLPHHFPSPLGHIWGYSGDLFIYLFIYLFID